jgi:hypothetical protein
MVDPAMKHWVCTHREEWSVQTKTEWELKQDRFAAPRQSRLDRLQDVVDAWGSKRGLLP